MRRNGSGAIVNISSAQAVASQKNVVAYTASKGAIVAMTRAMAVDHAHEGIRVNSICPGSIDTPMLRAGAREVSPDDPDRVIEEWGSMYPMRRVGSLAKWPTRCFPCEPVGFVRDRRRLTSRWWVACRRRPGCPGGQRR